MYSLCTVSACCILPPKVRAGATLLFDSEPELEEAETELKASAMIDAVTRSDPEPGATGSEVGQALLRRLLP